MENGRRYDYTRCNGMGNRKDVIEELKCSVDLNLCSPRNKFECVSSEMFIMTCLPPDRINDEHMDFLGGIDKHLFCREVSLQAHSRQ